MSIETYIPAFLVFFAILLVHALIIWQSRGVFFPKKSPSGKTLAFLAIAIAIIAAIALFATPSLMPSCGNWIADPGKTATDLVHNYKSRLSDYGESREIVFTSMVNSLNTKSIATQANVGLDPSQICLSLGDFQGDTIFEFKEGIQNSVIIDYVGFSQASAKIGVICDEGRKLQQDLENNGVDSEIRCSAGMPDSDETWTYCALVLKKA